MGKEKTSSGAPEPGKFEVKRPVVEKEPFKIPKEAVSETETKALAQPAEDKNEELTAQEKEPNRLTEKLQKDIAAIIRDEDIPANEKKETVVQEVRQYLEEKALTAEELLQQLDAEKEENLSPEARDLKDALEAIVEDQKKEQRAKEKKVAQALGELFAYEQLAEAETAAELANHIKARLQKKDLTPEMQEQIRSLAKLIIKVRRHPEETKQALRIATRIARLVENLRLRKQPEEPLLTQTLPDLVETLTQESKVAPPDEDIAKAQATVENYFQEKGVANIRSGSEALERLEANEEKFVTEDLAPTEKAKLRQENQAIEGAFQELAANPQAVKSLLGSENAQRIAAIQKHLEAALKTGSTSLSEAFRQLGALSALQERVKNPVAQRLVEIIAGQEMKKIMETVGVEKIEDENDLVQTAAAFRRAIQSIPSSFPNELTNQLAGQLNQLVHRALQESEDRAKAHELIRIWETAISKFLFLSLPNDPAMLQTVFAGGESSSRVISPDSLVAMLQIDSVKVVHDTLLDAMYDPDAKSKELKKNYQELSQYQEFSQWVKDTILPKVEKQLNHHAGRNDFQLESLVNFIYGTMVLPFHLDANYKLLPPNYKKSRGAFAGWASHINMGRLGQSIEKTFGRFRYYDQKTGQGVGEKINLGQSNFNEILLRQLDKDAIHKLEETGWQMEADPRRLIDWQGRTIPPENQRLFVKKEGKRTREIEVLVKNNEDGELVIAAVVEMREKDENGQEHPTTFNSEEFGRLLEGTDTNFLHDKVIKGGVTQPEKTRVVLLKEKLLTDPIGHDPNIEQEIARVRELVYGADAFQHLPQRRVDKTTQPWELSREDMVTLYLEAVWEASKTVEGRMLWEPFREAPYAVWRSILDRSALYSDSSYLKKKIMGSNFVSRWFRRSIQSQLEIYTLPLRMEAYQGILIGSLLGEFLKLILKGLLGSEDTRALAQAFGA